MSTENQILEAAEAVFLEKGFAAARTNEISERAGVNHALLHYYFRSKDKLFEVVLKKNLTDLAQSLISAFTTDKDAGIDAILSGVKAHFNILRNKPQLPRFIVIEIFSKLERAPMMKSFIEETTMPIGKEIKKSLDAIGSDMDVQTLIYDIVALNCFAFLTLPINEAMGADRDEFLDSKLNENLTLIRSRIISPSK